MSDYYHEAGKGSVPRNVDKQKYDEGYDRIFGKRQLELPISACLKQCKGDPTTETCIACGRTYEEIKDANKK